MTRLHSGKVALVTGASSGLGEAIAEALALQGAAVVVTARRADRLAALVKRIEGTGGQALALAADVSAPQDATRLVEKAIEWKGRLDILVNNAGLSRSGVNIGESTFEDMRDVVDINLLALMNVTRLAIPALCKTQGDIINLSSVAAKMALPQSAVYGATKAAIAAFSDSLRKELAGQRVRVSTIYPGAVESEIWNRISDPDKHRAHQDWMRAIEAMTPKDIADVVLFILGCPRHVAVHEIVVRPTLQESA